MARDDSKIVVTEAWVDDTVDLGACADETKVIVIVGISTVQCDPSLGYVCIICSISLF
jgi:hypothetical protein